MSTTECAHAKRAKEKRELYLSLHDTNVGDAPSYSISNSVLCVVKGGVMGDDDDGGGGSAALQTVQRAESLPMSVAKSTPRQTETPERSRIPLESGISAYMSQSYCTRWAPR